MISGHTDDIGDARKNQISSKKRAKSATNYLITRDIHIPKITTQGKDETQPITSNHSPEGRKLNRRVAFDIIEK